MRKVMFSMLAAAAATALPSGAAATNGAPSVRQVYDAGRCIAERDRGTAIALLGSLPLEGGTADLSRLPAEVAGRCARGLTSAGALHLRGAIAQTLFFRDFGGFGTEPRRSARLVDLRLPVQDSPAGEREIELYRWSDCIVRNDPAHAEQLMSSPVGSLGEERAIGAMRDYMAACAPAGAQIAVLPSELRSVIAQSAYHSMYRYWTGRLGSVRE